MRWPHRIPLAVHAGQSLARSWLRWTHDFDVRIACAGVRFRQGDGQRLVLRHAREGGGPLLAIHDVSGLCDLTRPFHGSAVTKSVQSPNGSLLQHRRGGPTCSVRSASHSKDGRTAAYNAWGRRYMSHERSRHRDHWRCGSHAKHFFREEKVARGCLVAYRTRGTEPAALNRTIGCHVAQDRVTRCRGTPGANMVETKSAGLAVRIWPAASELTTLPTEVEGKYRAQSTRGPKWMVGTRRRAQVGARLPDPR